MKRAATYRRGWNAALRYMGQTAAHLPEQCHELAVPVIRALCCDLRLARPRGGTNAELGRKYSASVRTIVNWRKAGCPFAAGKPAVMRWLATRRSVPPRAEKRFAKKLPGLRIDHCLAMIKAGFRELRVERRIWRRKRWPIPDWVARI